MKIGADIFKRLLAAFGGISGFEIDNAASSRVTNGWIFDSDGFGGVS
jgi:hypothetical protein